MGRKSVKRELFSLCVFVGVNIMADTIQNATDYVDVDGTHYGYVEIDALSYDAITTDDDNVNWAAYNEDGIDGDDAMLAQGANKAMGNGTDSCLTYRVQFAKAGTYTFYFKARSLTKSEYTLPDILNTENPAANDSFFAKWEDGVSIKYNNTYRLAGSTNTYDQATTSYAWYTGSESVLAFDISEEDVSNSTVKTLNIYTRESGFVMDRITLVENGGGLEDNGDWQAEALEDLASYNETVTPAIGMTVAQDGNLLSWTVDAEVGVKEYQIVDAATGEVVEVVVAGNGSYSTTLPEGVEAKLVVIDNAGYAQTFIPDDGNILKVVYDLKEGWNLIAMPGDNADVANLKDVVGDFWAWNGIAYEATDAPKACQGIWVYAPKAVQTVVTTEKSDAEIELNSGWNLMGPKENIKVPDTAHTVYGWNETYQELLEGGTMIQGIGYWVFSL